MGVSKVNDNIYADLGYGDVGLSFRTGKHCHSFYIEDMKVEAEVGTFVNRNEVINPDAPKITLTFDKHSVDSLDFLIIRLLEFRQAAFGPQPSRF